MHPEFFFAAQVASHAHHGGFSLNQTLHSPIALGVALVILLFCLPAMLGLSRGS